MRSYTINNKAFIVYESDDELPVNIKPVPDWRNAKEGEWIKADDGCYAQVLKRGTMNPKGKNPNSYIRICTGTFPCSKKISIDTEKRHNIYSFAGNKTSSKQAFDRETINNRESVFALFIAQGLSPVEAYLKAFKTENRKYAEQKALLLLKTERIKSQVKKEIKPVLAKLQIDPEFVLAGIRDIAQNGKFDGERLRAFMKLGEILEIEDKGNKESAVAMVGFQGFKPESIQAVEKIMELDE